MNEFQLIKDLTKNFKKYQNKNIIKGIGDDTAVFQHSNKNKYLLYTTDSLVENIHFKINYPLNKKKLFSALGWKLLAINVSDIFSMQGRPLYALISLFIPKNFVINQLHYIYYGLKKCANYYSVEIVGGNISKTNKNLILSLSLIGEVEKTKMSLREGAKNEDYIYIEKNIGCSKAGLELLKKGKIKDKFLIFSHLRPTPEYIWDKLRNFKITSSIDISDGLIGDLNHILESSKKGAEIFISAIPVNKKLQTLFPDKYLDFILYGGEDYKMLFTSPDEIKVKNIYKIGKIIDTQNIFLVRKNKKIIIQKKIAYSHF